MPLGNQPIVDKVVLTAGADWAHRINAGAGDEIPLGTTAVIRFYETADTDAAVVAEFDAFNVNAVYAEWRVESEDVDPIEKGFFFRVYVIYPDDPTFENCWYRGKVVREQ